MLLQFYKTLNYEMHSRYFL